jgi:hypothetical protein
MVLILLHKSISDEGLEKITNFMPSALHFVFKTNQTEGSKHVRVVTLCVEFHTF